MKDLAYAFTICFMALGPLKTAPVFFLTTQRVDRRTALVLAAKSTVLATTIVLFVALVASGTLVSWRVSTDAIAIAGGIVLLLASVRTLSTFQPAEMPAVEAGAVGEPPAAAPSTRWLGSPVLSPLVVPAILPPIGIVVILYFAGIALGDPAFHARLVGLLLAIMATNFLAMVYAGPIMRLVGFPVLQIVGWVFSALQAGLAVQIILNALRVSRVIP